ncbi:MAG: hypothetical protein COA82_03415 [Alkaliphilus sp.]|nr:MAG: hypothetical protein COA82_03415 [Alkaliphilus sp.]
MKDDSYIPRKVSTAIDKDWVMDAVGQENIIAKFLPCSLTDIQDCTNSNSLICSPLRSNDTSPSMGMRKYNNGKIYIKDFSGHFEGDCFDLVKRRMVMFTTDVPQFIQILETILAAFNYKEYKVKIDIETMISVRQTTEFTTELRDENLFDEKLWRKWAIRINHLIAHDVFFISRIILHGRVIYSYTTGDPCYGYFMGVDEYGIDIWKFYFPLRKKGDKDKTRFLCNYSMIEGGKFLRKAKYGIITKSFKDVISIHNYKRYFDVNAVAPSGEGKILTVPQMDYLKLHWDNIYTLSDFDRTGIRFAHTMRKLYGTKPLFLTNGKHGTFDYGAKDHTDYISKYGKDQMLELSTQLVENKFKSNNDWFDFISNYLNHY